MAGSATTTPEARLAAQLVAAVGEGPFTAEELANALVQLDHPDALREALAEALTGARVDEERNQFSAGLWGPPPTTAELAVARLEGQAAVDEALSAALAGALTRAQAAQRLGISPQAVSKRLAGGRLIALRVGREQRLPSWQFHEDGVLPGLAEVIDAWPGTPLALTTWATSPSADLGGLPPARALTRRGGVARVLDAIVPLTARAW